MWLIVKALDLILNIDRKKKIALVKSLSGRSSLLSFNPRYYRNLVNIEIRPQA